MIDSKSTRTKRSYQAGEACDESARAKRLNSLLQAAAIQIEPEAETDPQHPKVHQSCDQAARKGYSAANSESSVRYRLANGTSNMDILPRHVSTMASPLASPFESIDYSAARPYQSSRGQELSQPPRMHRSLPLTFQGKPLSTTTTSVSTATRTGLAGAAALSFSRLAAGSHNLKELSHLTQPTFSVCTVTRLACVAASAS